MFSLASPQKRLGHEAELTGDAELKSVLDRTARRAQCYGHLIFSHPDTSGRDDCDRCYGRCVHARTDHRLRDGRRAQRMRQQVQRPTGRADSGGRHAQVPRGGRESRRPTAFSMSLCTKSPRRRWRWLRFSPMVVMLPHHRVRCWNASSSQLNRPMLWCVVRFCINARTGTRAFCLFGNFAKVNHIDLLSLPGDFGIRLDGSHSNLQFFQLSHRSLRPSPEPNLRCKVTQYHKLLGVQAGIGLFKNRCHFVPQ